MNKKEYLLACIAEEAGEVAQEAMKIARFGNKYKDKDHLDLLKREIHDLIGVYYMFLSNEFPETEKRGAFDSRDRWGINKILVYNKISKTELNFDRSKAVGRLDVE